MAEFTAPDGKIWEVNTVRANWKYPAHRALRWRVYEDCNYQCCVCGAKAIRHDGWRGDKTLLTADGQTLDLDHIVPVKKGGRFAYGNLQLLCQSCNTKKGAQ